MAIVTNNSEFALETDGQRLPLETGVTIVGRQKSICDLVLPHSSVSRVHCLFIIDADGIRVRDLGSVNGVRIQGQKVTDAVVFPGDSFLIASCPCRIVRSQGPGQTSGSTAKARKKTRSRDTESLLSSAREATDLDISATINDDFLDRLGAALETPSAGSKTTPGAKVRSKRNAVRSGEVQKQSAGLTRNSRSQTTNEDMPPPLPRRSRASESFGDSFEDDFSTGTAGSGIVSGLAPFLKNPLFAIFLLMLVAYGFMWLTGWL